MHEPLDKIDADHQECPRQMQYIAHRNFQPPPALPGHPPILHELYDALFQPFLLQQQPLPQEFVVATWYSDHVRRPHSGLSREVHLNGDFARWLHDLVMAWEDWIDPFADIQWALVRPSPEEIGVHAHVILIQHARDDFRSVIVAVSDVRKDPWHPRLLCFMLSVEASHQALLDLVDFDHECHRPETSLKCTTFWNNRDMTRLPHFLLSMVYFCPFTSICAQIQHQVPLYRRKLGPPLQTMMQMMFWPGYKLTRRALVVF